MRRTLGLVLILGAAFTALPRGQQQPVFVPPSPGADPTFRSAVEYVQVDVVATDRSGQPVTNLTADDFEVFENGKPQIIKTFMPVDIPFQRATPLPAGVETDVQSNARPDGHLYVFVLAGTNAEMALRTRHLARTFIEEYFGDNDIAAVVTGRSFEGDRQDFTSNRRLLLSAIDKFEGTQIDLAELADLMEMTAAMPINRKVVLWFGDPHIDPYNFIDYNGGVFRTRHDEDAHAVLAAATRGNIRFYLFEPSGLMLGDQSQAAVVPVNIAKEVEARNNYRALAAMTGGVATINTNKFGPAFERMVSETSRYYLLGFESTTRKTPGRYVRLEVKSKRSDLTVRARTGYLEYMKYNQQRNNVPPTRTPVEAAIASPLSTPGIGMRVVATPYRKSATEATVAVSIDLDASKLSFTEKDGRHVADVEIRHLATDADHRIYPLHRFNTTLSLDDTELAQAKAHGLRIASQFDVPAGRYQLRVASASGTRNGSVIYDLEVPDFAVAPITMSGVSLIASSDLDTMTLRPGALKGNQGKVKQCRVSSCEPAIVKTSTMTAWRAPGPSATGSIVAEGLPAAPSTMRTFNASETLTLFTEIYDNNPSLKTSAAYDLRLTTELRNEAGIAARSLSDVRPAQEPVRASGGHGFTVKLPLANVAPGTYILHVEGRSTHATAPMVMRDIPIRVE